MSDGAALRKSMTFGESGTAFALVLLGFAGLYISAMGMDIGYQIHAFLFALASFAGVILITSQFAKRPAVIPQENRREAQLQYGPVKFATVAAMIWGIAGFTVGLIIAQPARLAMAQLRSALDEFRTPASTAHLGGDLRLRRQRAAGHLVYVVQRTTHAASRQHRPWFVILGYNFFIVIAGTGYLLGITQGKEYAEPEW